MKERQRALLQSWDGSSPQEAALEVTQKEDARIDSDIAIAEKTVKTSSDRLIYRRKKWCGWSTCQSDVHR